MRGDHALPLLPPLLLTIALGQGLVVAQRPRHRVRNTQPRRIHRVAIDLLAVGARGGEDRPHGLAAGRNVERPGAARVRGVHTRAAPHQHVDELHGSPTSTRSDVQERLAARQLLTGRGADRAVLGRILHGSVVPASKHQLTELFGSGLAA